MIQTPEPLERLLNRSRDAFIARYAAPPDVFAIAPGRVNLIGEHVDYCDGFVLPFAIPMYAVLAAKIRTDRRSIILATDADLPETEIPLGAPLSPSPPAWSNYAKGVIDGFQRIPVSLKNGADTLLVSSIPIGAGLSSSAAIEVAYATLLESLAGVNLDKLEKSILCQHAEHDFADMPCGIMDQYTAVHGETDHFILLDCQSHSSKLIPFQSKQHCLLLANTKIKHALVDGEYATRRSQIENALQLLGKSSWREVTHAELNTLITPESDLHFRRARHVVTEISRTKGAGEALMRNDLDSLGELMFQSHASLRDDYEVSCPELDTLVQTAQQIGTDGGLYGARMTGGGFGGSVIALCDASHVDNIAETLAQRYKSAHGSTPDFTLVHPAQGAHLRSAIV